MRAAAATCRDTPASCRGPGPGLVAQQCEAPAPSYLLGAPSPRWLALRSGVEVPEWGLLLRPKPSLAVKDLVLLRTASGMAALTVLSPSPRAVMPSVLPPLSTTELMAR